MKIVFACWVLLCFVPWAVRGNTCPEGEDTLMTYNAGLTPTVPDFESRRGRIPGAVATEAANADFMCFQELWYEEDVRSVLDAVQDELPYQYSHLHFGISDMTGHRRRRHSDDYPCGVWALTKLSACLAWNCLSATDQNLCMTTNCADKLFSNSQECISCIAVSSSSVQEVWSQCAGISWFSSNNRFNAPGLVVASRRPMTAEYISYTPEAKVLLERGYIKAQVENGPLILCTHLTAVFSTYYEVNLPYSNYTEQQRAEIETMRNEFSGSAHVLMGDLNTGPVVMGLGDTDLRGEAPTNYDVLTDIGYTNPFLDTVGECTFCASNAVVQQRGYTMSNLIDHVLLKDLQADSSTARRLFDDPNLGTLSDHYGVSLDVCRP